MKLESKLSKLPTYLEELGLDSSKPGDRFKWFLASILFAKRISAEIAKQTFREFEKRKLVTHDKILDAGWDRLVEVLDSGGYVRYDFSTARNLLKAMKALKKRYGGLEKLHEESSSPRDLEKRLLEFAGVGPVTVNIFLRELRDVWKNADPKPSRMAVKISRQLGLKEVKRFESSLVRLNLEFCKKHRCEECPVSEFCEKRGGR